MAHIQQFRVQLRDDPAGFSVSGTPADPDGPSWDAAADLSSLWSEVGL
jgi:hypothetical protein